MAHDKAFAFNPQRSEEAESWLEQAEISLCTGSAFFFLAARRAGFKDGTVFFPNGAGAAPSEAGCISAYVLSGTYG